jgi:spoIIIJ-associated protein
MSEIEEQEISVETASEAPVVPLESLNDDQQIAYTLVHEFCAASGLGAHAVVRAVHKPYISIEILGGDVRITLGKMGQGLDALQFLLNTIIMRRVGSDTRLLLDAEGYRERRAEALRLRARELADEVKLRKEEAELEPLPAHERRIIHAALADDPEISTYSEGDEPARRVVIAPRVA